MTLEQVIEKTVNAEVKVLNNTEAGQEITEKLIEIVKASNPNITMEEWREVQRDFLSWIFFQFMKDNKEARDVLAAAFYQEARA